ncbi:hypothetical protein D3C71_448620 [compost metagenome]
MNKRYLLALVNTILLVSLSLFAWDKYLVVKDYFTEFEIKFDLSHVFKAMKHDILVLFTGMLSLVGILFFNRQKTFFFVSIFYASIVLVLIFLLRSISPLTVIVVISEIIFLWLLIWNNTFLVFENKRGIKLVFLTIGALVYFCSFHIGR